LAPIGAIVAEIGSARQGSGLACRIVESGDRFDVPRAFAGPVPGFSDWGAILPMTTALSHLMLRAWRAGARSREA
jgi:NitT/TauT family transport system permease protein